MATGSKKAVWLIGIYNWLAQGDAQQKSDVIFVLAGRECRKWFGLRLLKEGWGDRLLLSVGRFEIRRFGDLTLPVSLDMRAIAGKTTPEQRHYLVDIEGRRAECSRIDIGRFGTWSEILAFSNWLHKNQAIRSATVVSSGFHIRRIRVCCRRLVRANCRLTFLAVPDEDERFRNGWWRDPKCRQLVLKELAKLAVYKILGIRIMGVLFNDGSPRCSMAASKQEWDKGMKRDIPSPAASVRSKTAGPGASTAQLLDSAAGGTRIATKDLFGHSVRRRWRL